MNKKISLGITISLVAITAAITFILTTTFSLNLFNSTVQNVKERAELYKKLDELDNYARANYAGDIDEEYLLDSISRGYVAGMEDKYSAYHTIDEYQKEKLSNVGTLVGIGVSVEKEESGYIRIKSITENSSAAEGGLAAGDVIVAVNDNDVIAKGYATSVSAIQGDEGTSVKLTIRRDGEDSQLQFTRKRMEIISVVSRMIKNTNTGYIKITEFNMKTPDQFKSALDKLTSQGAKQLVFDVRNNNGGLLDSVSAVINYLLPAGEIATATYKDGTTKVIVKTDNINVVKLPMTVIINSHTASSAELFAAALRDAGSSLIGSVSYGKGVMQSTFECLDGSAITVTVATYATSKTPCYDGIGLKPTFEVVLTTDEEAAFDILDETTDPQLRKAIEIAQSTK